VAVGKLPFNLRAPSADPARMAGFCSGQIRRPPFSRQLCTALNASSRSRGEMSSENEW
jgi:hypothetical protein